MITTRLKGGLGNQLFQIFQIIAYGIEHNLEYEFQYSENLAERPTYWNNMLVSIKKFTKNTVSSSYKMIIREQPSTLYMVYSKMDGVVFDGYFQSYKYFEKHYNSIIELIQLDKQKKMIRELYRDYFKDDTVEVISLHFRVGDYKNLPLYHPLLPLSYYRNSLKKLIDINGKDDYRVVYFNEVGDKEYVDKMVDELKKEFPKISFVAINHTIPDWQQMLVMSLCHHNIIANSSFSWWGAYFNDNCKKIVCYPAKWYGVALSQIQTRDLVKPEWYQIDF
jgi:hypothetical protein